MSITSEHVENALRIIEQWRTSAKLAKKAKAVKDCELVLRVIRGLAGK